MDVGRGRATEKGLVARTKTAEKVGSRGEAGGERESDRGVFKVHAFKVCAGGYVRPICQRYDRKRRCGDCAQEETTQPDVQSRVLVLSLEGGL